MGIRGKVFSRNECDVIGEWLWDPSRGPQPRTFFHVPSTLLAIDASDHSRLLLPDGHKAQVTAIQISDPDVVLWLSRENRPRAFSGPWRERGEPMVPTSWTKDLHARVEFVGGHEVQNGAFRLRMIVDVPESNEVAP